jgi:hypothetical protein
VRYRIYFVEGIHPPVEVTCGRLVVKGARRISTYPFPTSAGAGYSVDLSFTHDMSRIMDDHDRPMLLPEGQEV